MSGFRVVVCGGGIAAVEGLLRLRRLVGDGVDVTMVAPDGELRYRPLSVKEPFAARRRGATRSRRSPRGPAPSCCRTRWSGSTATARSCTPREGQSLPYDALLLAIGVRSVPAFEHVTTFDDAHADDTFRGIVQDIEEGYTKRVALFVPEGPAWSLPVYELALQTADRAFGRRASTT